MKKLLSVLVVSVLLAACSSSSPISSIEGLWTGSITSTVYDETTSATLEVGPKGTDTDLHDATLNGKNISCEGNPSEMTCFLFGLSESLLMEGSISGRTWHGTFAFDSDTYGYDSGTFSFTKR